MTEYTLQGIPAAPGVAIGPVFRFAPPDLTVPERTPEAPEAEMERFRTARAQAIEELKAVKARMAERVDEETAAIFDAHMMLADDPTMEGEVRNAVEGGQTVEAAVDAVTEALAAQFRQMEDEYFAARAADIEDVGGRILRILLGLPERSLAAIGKPSIIVAKDLTPGDTASLDPQNTLGICTALGGTTAHSAIIARTLGLPAVVGLGEKELEAVEDGMMVALDGADGSVVLHPTDQTVEAYERRYALRAERLARAQEIALEKAVNASGREIEVEANISSVESAREAVQYGAEGVGLLRTEFLYLDRVSPPSEDEQIAILRPIFEAMGSERPIVVRTLDIGGDKPPSFMEFEEEENPFLGWRAIRISLEKTPLFTTQMRAILRAAEGFNVLMMHPMVVNLDEIQQANALLEEVKDNLRKEGHPFNENVPTGIMVETPAAAVMAETLAEHVDFFSIGANDLTQYTLAADRGNDRVAHLFNGLDPAVLKLVKMTIDGSHAKGKWTGMCGELAGVPKAIPILMGLGLDAFSMVPRAIPEAKWLMRQITDARAEEIAEHALNLPTAHEVDAYMTAVLSDFGM